MATRRKTVSHHEHGFRVVTSLVVAAYQAFRDGTLAAVDLPIVTTPSAGDAEYAAQVAELVACEK
jgi:hypothetical protein